ncbi:MAG: type II secretion system GspH family protein [Deltaproteobacteria bacterium]|nr:type II secretion system GspH family protein [Deltaproteobacteria bacterium]
MTEDEGQWTEGSGRKAKPDTFHLSPFTFHLKPGVSRGFTLLEILLAIFILTLVVSAVFGAFRGTFKVVTETETQEEIYATARVALERMCEDLASAYGGSNQAEVKKTPGQPIFVGEDHQVNDQSADALYFLSRSHISFKSGHQEGGAAEIGYYTQYHEKTQRLSLYRSDTLDYLESPEDGQGGLLLCEGLKWLDFIYYDKNGDPHKTWEGKESDSNGALPSRVEISIGFENALDPEKPLQFITGVALPPIM